MLPKPIGYRYFYFDEDFELVEITKEEYERRTLWK